MCKNLRTTRFGQNLLVLIKSVYGDGLKYAKTYASRDKLGTELGFRVGFSSWTFELDFRVRISSWTFQQETSADVTADLPPPPFFSIPKTDKNHVQTRSREIFSAMSAVSLIQ